MKKLLIIGLGDVAKRAVPLLNGWHIDAPSRAVFDLDCPNFTALPRAFDALLYTAPPQNTGLEDERLSRVLDFWRQQGGSPQHVVYISTTGVYGDCGGEWVNEQHLPSPLSDRAQRRLNAELALQKFALEMNVQVTILRAPGIYALERLPIQRIKAGVPILHEAQDSYSNHIHADDLAAICLAALQKPCGIKIYNACDDMPLKMGDWFVALAQAVGLPVPERQSRDELQRQLSPLQWSFMRESRRIKNDLLKQELDVCLRYPSVLDFLFEHAKALLILSKKE